MESDIGHKTKNLKKHGGENDLSTPVSRRGPAAAACLPDDVLSFISTYLNLAEKVTFSAACTSWRRAAFRDQDVLLHPKIVGPNMDTALDFVSARFQHLNEVTIYVPQPYILPSLGAWTKTPSVRLSAPHIRNFFAQCHPLKSVRISFEEGCEHEVRKITRGDTWDTLAKHDTIEVFDTRHIIFPRIGDLTQLLGRWNQLAVLNLGMTGFGECAIELGAQGLASAMNSLFKAVGSLSSLRKLGLAGWPLHDAHMEILLRRLNCLASLDVSGVPGHNARINGGPGYLSDDALVTVTRRCPKLQNLNISYNQRVTKNGVCHVLRGCPLRELNVSETKVAPNHFVELCEQTSTLILLHCTFDEPPFERFGTRHNKEVHEAAMASGGRLILHEFFVGIVEVFPPVVGVTLEERAKSLQIINVVKKIRSAKGGNHNEWEWML